MSYDERSELLAQVLGQEDLDQIFLLPEVRRYVEQIERRRTSSVND
jgi:hypothetical protein